MTAWRFFPVEVCALRRLSPAFLRVTFAGDGLDRFADNGYDQRIKFIPPLPGHGLAHLPTGEDWYAEWCALPDERRNPMRTYTVRAVRPGVREVDIDMALHGATGPASTWAAEARPGSTACLMRPSADYDGVHGGLDYRPGEAAGFVLLGGDESAVPAISAILERMPGDARAGRHFSKCLRTWTGGDSGGRTAYASIGCPERGRRTAKDWFRPFAKRRAGFSAEAEQPASRKLEDIDVDVDDLWEVPEPVADGGRFYAWPSGEAAVIRTLRRHLVAECGVDRRGGFHGLLAPGPPRDNGLARSRPFTRGVTTRSVTRRTRDATRE